MDSGLNVNMRASVDATNAYERRVYLDLCVGYCVHEVIHHRHILSLSVAQSAEVPSYLCCRSVIQQPSARQQAYLTEIIQQRVMVGWFLLTTAINGYTVIMTRAATIIGVDVIIADIGGPIKALVTYVVVVIPVAV